MLFAQVALRQIHNCAILLQVPEQLFKMLTVFFFTLRIDEYIVDISVDEVETTKGSVDKPLECLRCVKIEAHEGKF